MKIEKDKYGLRTEIDVEILTNNDQVYKLIPSPTNLMCYAYSDQDEDDINKVSICLGDMNLNDNSAIIFIEITLLNAEIFSKSLSEVIDFKNKQLNNIHP